VLVGGQVNLDLVRSGGAKWADVRDRWFVSFGELKVGDGHMVPSCLQHLAEGDG
jgi:hypothetical protein